ncbi:MAG: hypothetical protein IIX10_06275 [Clostridia bacterium]|nr:hypothetical protein [Clostridia bacterium]
MQWLGEHAHRDGRRTIIACDFDGTLCESHYPVIVRPNKPLIEAVKLLQKLDYELILWTCRELDDLTIATDYLKQFDLVFERANENSPAIIEYFDFDSRKINADEYWDDKAIEIVIPEEEE